MEAEPLESRGYSYLYDKYNLRERRGRGGGGGRAHRETQPLCSEKSLPAAGCPGEHLWQSPLSACLKNRKPDINQ
jgi:hypothetical protein